VVDERGLADDEHRVSFSQDATWWAEVVMGLFRLWLGLVLVLVWVLPPATGQAEILGTDIPDAIWGSEMLPPTAADWIRAYLREVEQPHGARAAFGHSGGHACRKGGCPSVLRRLEPISLNAEVEYLPCSAEPRCGCARSTLHSGEYGIFHPAPYYIPNPTLGVELSPTCGCRGSSHTAAKISPDPNNRIEMTLGVWE
jgi:hypothetical protein